ncbi:hypothetical protein BJI67_06760 [Acidihalobacter aeolianus]|uniref:Carboxymuconolactone decarboxylase-like domain-containing protein n=1 Tax=Acidihalobacter aeolianus TaxID=2792603 RepID=A0A1D8K794_9GAMM|nr:hypothetical protein [Acidihalobacter aeolianus]AOV16800.1 hypothetical protein BJI67_06760 [Acidihalobacter aeolianus]
MSEPLLVPQVGPQDKPKVDAIFAAVEERMGFVPDALKLYSLSPALLESFLGVIGYFSTESPLGPRLAAMIRYLGSYRANCTFCIDLNEGYLTSMGLDLDDIRRAREDIDAAPLEPNEMPLLRLAMKSTSMPETVSAADIEACRTAGWDDRAIFEAVVHATNNRAFNQLLSTFKVEHQGAYAA